MSDKCLVTFWGTRGSIPTPGRMTEKYGGNTSCVSLRYEDDIVIFDAGTGLRNLGIELASELSKKKESLPLHLFLSHTHWDHIQGLPFFAPAYMKDVKITIFGSPQKEGVLKEILRGQMDSTYFPIDMSYLGADISVKEMTSETMKLGALNVCWQEQIHHPGGTVRYRVEINGKKCVYATDVELNNIFWAKDSSAEVEQQVEDYLEFIEGADLLIADGQYTAEEYETKKGWGHTSIPVLLEAAYQARVKQVAVFHHEPLFSDRRIDELYMEHSTVYHNAEPAMNVFWAREGMTLAL